MDRDEIKEKVYLILKSVLKHENFVLSDQTTAADVDGWDSLTHMMIISEVEKTFNITFKLKELYKMKNIGDMIDLIISK
ncbi:MAG TPA: acyl carrier protein [Flavobacterium sp.]|uniref:acyl carrier protein n=1 Tax=Flavobacterium sp. TaxID=239 RepID=UPI002C0330A3|nr:acyl carrier protein [Flavobacterium sp.]HNP33131.1 acyl carrier protein [Flavobacterium sp.]